MSDEEHFLVKQTKDSNLRKIVRGDGYSDQWMTRWAEAAAPAMRGSLNCN